MCFPIQKTKGVKRTLEVKTINLIWMMMKEEFEESEQHTIEEQPMPSTCLQSKEFVVGEEKELTGYQSESMQGECSAA